MGAILKGHHDIVRTLLEGGGDVNAKDKVRNQIMMMILLTFFLMMMIMIIIIFINDKDRNDCR